MDFDIRDIKEFLKDASGYIIAMLLVFLLVVYVVSMQIVKGPSMEPNYRNQDILILNKMHYRLFKPKRFDVVAVQDREDYIIKRVIGLPGEKIEYKDNVLYINGVVVAENFKKATDTKDFSLSILELDVIPDNHYLVVGDNRENSTDSRNPKVGVISIDDFLGKVAFRIWRVEK